MSIQWQNTSERNHERGSALIIGIVFLLILTMIGVAGMQTSVLEERMAGNLRDRELAFQAAEAGLRDAEEEVLEKAVLPTFKSTYPSSKGLYQENATSWENIAWEAGDSAEYSGDFNGTAAKPRYIIEELPISTGSSPSLSPDDPVPMEGLFRVTARGVGGTNTSEVILQSTYKR